LSSTWTTTDAGRVGTAFVVVHLDDIRLSTRDREDRRSPEVTREADASV
jgi:hypothetical protein